MPKIKTTDALRAAVATVKASRWDLWRARLFGRKIEAWDDGGSLVIAHSWRGKIYITDIQNRALSGAESGR